MIYCFMKNDFESGISCVGTLECDSVRATQLAHHYSRMNACDIEVQSFNGESFQTDVLICDHGMAWFKGEDPMEQHMGRDV